jgi:hypothetical protein
MNYRDIDIFAGELNPEQQALMQRPTEGMVMSPAGPIQADAGPTLPQAANFLGLMTGAGGVADVLGQYPEMPSEGMTMMEMATGPTMPSLMENVEQGNYLDALFQAAGVIPGVGAARGMRGGIDTLGAFGGQAARARQADAPQALRDVGGMRQAGFLTEKEVPKLARADTSKKFMEFLSQLPTAREMATVAEAGAAKRGWYRQSADALIDIFGQDDAPRFAGILAATSPQTSVQSNLLNTSNIFKNWKAAGSPGDPRLFDLINKPGIAMALKNRKIVGGKSVPISEKEAREIFRNAGGDDGLYDLGRYQLEIMGESVQGSRGVDSVLDAWVGNTLRALNVPQDSMDRLVISGPKVDSFMRNLANNTIEVTNDTWMANYLGVNQKDFSGAMNAARTDPGKTPGYLATSALTRNAADILSNRLGEEVTPPEIQEMVWSFAKALVERSRNAGMTPREFLRAGKLDDFMINDTPDFATLMADPDLPYRKVVESAGGRVGDPKPSPVQEGSRPNELMGRDVSRRDLERAAIRLGKVKADEATLKALAPLVGITALAITQSPEQPQDDSED